MTTELESLREEINNLDKEMLDILEERFEICKEIAEIKKEQGMPVEDKKREDQIIQNKVNCTSLDSKFVKNLFALIFAESKSMQEKITNEC